MSRKNKPVLTSTPYLSFDKSILIAIVIALLNLFIIVRETIIKSNLYVDYLANDITDVNSNFSLSRTSGRNTKYMVRAFKFLIKNKSLKEGYITKVNIVPGSTNATLFKDTKVIHFDKVEIPPFSDKYIHVFIQLECENRDIIKKELSNSKMFFEFYDDNNLLIYSDGIRSAVTAIFK